MISRFIDDDTVLLFKWGGMLWSRCVTRKAMTNYDGGDDVPAKTVAWMPITNGRSRMKRINHVPKGAEILHRKTR